MESSRAQAVDDGVVSARVSSLARELGRADERALETQPLAPARARAVVRTRALRVALFTTPPDVRSGIGDYTRHLLPHLQAVGGSALELETFVEHGCDAPDHGCDAQGTRRRSVREFDASHFDRLWFQMGNESAHAWMRPWLVRHGGVVTLHDWVLFDQTVSAHPELVRSSRKGFVRAWREGGISQLSTYAASWARQGSARALHDDPAWCEEARHAVLLDGWHAPERDGRWTKATARFRVAEAEAVRMHVRVRAGCVLRVRQAHTRVKHVVNAGREESLVTFELPVDARRPALFELDVAGNRDDHAARARGDQRELGVYVHALERRVDGRWRAIDLACDALERRRRRPYLSDARFDLALNRTVLRAADGFLVHSEFLARRIRAARGDCVTFVQHGAERRFTDEDRRAVRQRLGLPPAWRESLLVASLGAQQAHKRLGVLLEAVARARADGVDVKLALVGAADAEAPSCARIARALGIEEHVRITGFVDEGTAHAWLHAADVCVNLRGPSTLGTSGGAYQALGCGRTVLVSDVPEFDALPDACVLRAPHGEHEARSIAEQFARLARSPGLRDELERAARAFVDTTCHWSTTARIALDALERHAPRAQSARQRAPAHESDATAG